jgi:signal transduction histidine kinase
MGLGAIVCSIGSAVRNRIEDRLFAATFERDQRNRELAVTLATLEDAQRRMIENEKLSALGRLLAQLSHEINNPVNVIQNNVPPVRDYLGSIDRVLVAANADCFSHDELVSWLIERAALAMGASLHIADGSALPGRANTASGITPVPAPVENVGWTRAAIDLARAHERVVLRERLRATFAAKRARGERIGTVPYGYRLATDGVHLELHEAEQDVIDTVRRLSNDGLSQRGIVAALEARGVKGRTGAHLRQTQVAKILRS